VTAVSFGFTTVKATQSIEHEKGDEERGSSRRLQLNRGCRDDDHQRNDRRPTSGEFFCTIVSPRPSTISFDVSVGRSSVLETRPGGQPWRSMYATTNRSKS
jgi:hypothetical protein